MNKLLSTLTILILFLLVSCSQTSSAQGTDSSADESTGTGIEDQSTEIETDAFWTTPDGREPRFLFVHHSTGSGFMFDGGMAGKLEDAGFEVHSRTYGDGWVGDNTNPDHFPITFTAHFDDLVTWDLESGEKYDVIAFKSCYPASNICSDEKLSEYKEYYATIKSVTSVHPEILFIAWSTPPLVPSATEPDCAERARIFANWLGGEYIEGESNLMSYNIFDVLAGNDSGSGDFNRLRFDYQKNSGDSHPNHDANVVVAEDFTEWLSGIVF